MKPNIELSDDLRKEIESMLYNDMSFIEIHTDNLCYWDKTDRLFDQIKEKYSVDDKFILNIIYNIIFDNQIDFNISISTFSFHIGGVDRFFRLNAKINYKLNNAINWSKINLVNIQREEAENKFKELVLTNQARLIDGNWKDVSEEEYTKVKLLCQIWFDKDLSKLLDLAEMYVNESKTYNNLILKYMIENKDNSVIDKLTCSDEIKKELKKSKFEDYIKIYYDNFYQFFEDEYLPSFAGNNPFYELYQSLFEAIKEAINNRNSDIISYARKLKIASEQFESALRDSSWIVNDKANLTSKFEIIVNFGRWLYKLKTYFEKEYYFPEKLKEELFDYLDLVEQKLYYPVIVLLTSNLHEEKYTIFEEYMRYTTYKDFKYDSITKKIDYDYNNNKEIEDICKRRNKKILWEDEGGPEDNTREKQFEDSLYNVLKQRYAKIEKNKRLLNHTGTDFLASDGKNTLILIEAKTGANAAKPNNIKKLFPIINALAINEAYYIINEDVTNEDSINTAKDFCQISNIKFIQTNSEGINLE